MGICGSRNMSPEDKSAADKSKKIDQNNEDDFRKNDGESNFVRLSFSV